MNIALVKLSSIGDVVHALPVAAALRASLPQAHLAWIVERREAAVLRGNAALSEIVPVDTRGWRRVRTVFSIAEATGATSISDTWMFHWRSSSRNASLIARIPNFDAL